MKILCINDKKQDGSQQPFLKYGVIYYTIGEGVSSDGEDCYELPNLPPTFSPSGKINVAALYKKSRFIPLSSIDETEFEREYNTQTLNLKS